MGPNLMLLKQPLELRYGSLVTPKQSTSIIIPLGPESTQVLFHSKIHSQEGNWSMGLCYKLQGGTAIRIKGGVLFFIYLLNSDKPTGGVQPEKS